jgi:hypothetical protein
MSVNYNPKIITDGLSLCLDAANPKSYPGSGTTWTDLSGSGNNGTLVNGPSYSSANKGTFAFDGVNDYVALPTNFFNFPSISNFSISLWFKSSQTTGATLFGQQNSSNPSSASGWVPVIYLRSDGLVRAEPFWTGSVNNAILSTNALNDDTWHNVTTTFGSGVHKLYIDGIFNSQQSGLSLTSYTSVYYYFLGAGYASSTRNLGNIYLSGEISNFDFYSITLTESEVRQNFQALRGRYGI